MLDGAADQNGVVAVESIAVRLGSSWIGLTSTQAPSALPLELLLTASVLPIAAATSPVDPAWVAATGNEEHLEKDMLECAMDLQDNSRLSCQIEVSDELDGLVVRMPELQI